MMGGKIKAVAGTCRLVLITAEDEYRYLSPAEVDRGLPDGRLVLVIGRTFYDLLDLCPDKRVAFPAWRLTKHAEPPRPAYDVHVDRHGAHCTCPDFHGRRENRDPKGCDAQRFLANTHRCREKLVSYSTREAYLDMIEDIYNFGRQKLVSLKIEALQIMKERNPAKMAAARAAAKRAAEDKKPPT